MNGHDAEARDYGPREDDTHSPIVDEEAQPLNLEEFEIDDYEAGSGARSIKLPHLMLESQFGLP